MDHDQPKGFVSTVAGLFLSSFLLLGLASCGGEARKLTNLIEKAQERHGGMDLFARTATFFVRYEIDDYGQGTARQHHLSIKQQGSLVRSEYKGAGITMTTVASRFSDKGWKQVSDASGRVQYGDILVPNDQLFSEMYAYEIDATDVFRLQRYVTGPSADTELGATLRLTTRYEKFETIEAEAIIVDGEELSADRWIPFTLKFVFDSSGKLSRKEKIFTFVDEEGKEIDTKITEIRYLDYRDTDGFLVPYRVEYRVNKELTQIYRLREFKPSVYWDPAEFMDPRPQAQADAAKEKPADTPTETKAPDIPEEGN